MRNDMNKPMGARKQARLNARRRLRARIYLLAALCLSVCAVLATGLTYSAYLSTATGTSETTVAKWAVSGAFGADNAVTLDATASSVSIPFTITNNGEVTVEYSKVTVTVKNGSTLLGEKITVKVDDTALDYSGDVYTGTLKSEVAIGSSKTHTLTIAKTENLTNSDNATYNVTVEVDASQKD